MPDSYCAIARQACGAYGLGERTDLTLLSLSENGTFLARDGDRVVILRVHRHGYHDRAAIESELAWMAQLRAEGTVATPELIPACDGRSVVEVRHAGVDRYVDAFAHIPGHTAEEAPDRVSFHALGAVTARLHQHALTWAPPHGFRRFSWDLDTTLGPEARWGQWEHGPGVGSKERRVLAAASAQVRQRLSEYGSGTDRFGLVHADLRMANLMVSADHALTVIDFDDCGWGWFMADLGAVVSWMEERPDLDMLVRQWLAGYLTVRALSAHDLEILSTFVMLRRLMLTAWLGSHPHSPPARTYGDRFAAGSAQVAARYLEDTAWMRFTREEFAHV